MTARKLGRTDLVIEPLVLGTNVVGWTADEATSFAVLDAFVDLGFTAIDTADSYSRWVPGNDSESERIIGRWMKARGNRDMVSIFTKVGSDMGQGKKDLSASWIAEAVEGSLSRLQTDHIDLYQSHFPDPTVSQEETLGAYQKLIEAGKVRYIGASNYDAALLGEALQMSADKGLPRYETLQNEFNLYTRERFDTALQDLLVHEEISGITYYGLASGFLTGKYRSEADFSKSARGGGMKRYLNERGLKILAALDAVAAETKATPSEVAIAWIVAQPAIGAPIASATSVEQVQSLAKGARLALTGEQLRVLSDAGK